MCDFDNLDDAEKAKYHQQLIDCVHAVGGKNFFLQLLEEIRKSKTHPLTAAGCKFHGSKAVIKWNKVIFKDKLSLLLKVRLNQGENGNVLPEKEDKSYKNVMNLLRTLNPVAFEVEPKNREDGAGFKIRAFDIIDENTTRLNPLFEALFFCSLERVKRAMNYVPKTL